MEGDLFDQIFGKRRRDTLDDPLVGRSGRRRRLDDTLESLGRGMDLALFGDDGLAPRGRRRRELDDEPFGRRRGGRAGGFDEDLFGFREHPFHYVDVERTAPMEDFTLFDDFAADYRGGFRAPAFEDDILEDIDLHRSRNMGPLGIERGMNLFASGSRGTFAEDLSRIWDADYIDDDDDPDAPWNVMDSTEYDPMNTVRYGDDPMAVFRSAVYDPPRRRAPSPSLTSGMRLPGANPNASFPRQRRMAGHRMGNPQAEMLLGARPLLGRADTRIPGEMEPRPRRYRELPPRR